MSGKVDKGFADSFFHAISDGVGHIIEPKPKTFWYKIVHEWLDLRVWVDYVGDWGISRGLFLFCLYTPLLIVMAVLVPQFPSLVFGWVLFALPVIAPIGAIAILWSVWIWYIQSLFIFQRVDPVLLEIKFPPHIKKSPRAMETVFSNLWTRMNTTTGFDRNWKGGMTPYYSFELVSLGGEVHFYIHCRRIFKNTIETNLYAQYPEVEIVEAEDYATKFVYDENVECFVTDYALTTNVAGAEGVDPLNPEISRSNAYPPKSYVDFELDQEEQENRPDPYATVMEILSQYNKHEQVWIQMVIRPHFGKTWKGVLEKEVETIREASAQVDGKVPEHGWRIFSSKQQQQIQIIERHLSKLPFEVGFRGIYISPAGQMRGPEYTLMRWIWRAFANPNWQSTLRPRRGHNDFDWPWQDWRNIRYRLFSRRFLDAYRRRCIFNYPWITPFHIMSTESLATLWHPPGKDVHARGIQRIATNKGTAPANLPI